MSSQKIVLQLFNKLHNPKLVRKKTRKSTKDCLIEFKSYLRMLRKKHVKRNYLDHPNFLVGQVYSNKDLKTKNEVKTYCKVQLFLADRHFNQIFELIEQKGLNHWNIKKYQELIFDFLHDLKPIVEYLEQISEPNYTFFNGGKWYGTRTLEVFRASKNLCLVSTEKLNLIDHRMGINLSVFSLRQALELKYRRIIGVETITSKLDKLPIKVPHDFYYLFIKENMNLFSFRTACLDEIFKVYRWTNFCIHTGNLPRVWEQLYALELVQPLFLPEKAKLGKAWSINSSVHISGLESLRSTFRSFLEQNEKIRGETDIHFVKPEAVVLNEEN